MYEKITPFKERNNKGFVTFNKDFRKKYDPRASIDGYQYSVFFKILGKIKSLIQIEKQKSDAQKKTQIVQDDLLDLMEEIMTNNMNYIKITNLEDERVNDNQIRELFTQSFGKYGKKSFAEYQTVQDVLNDLRSNQALYHDFKYSLEDFCERN